MAVITPAWRHDLETICCYKCGVEFAVPSHWRVKRTEDHESFWCPNGHRQSYFESEKDKRIKQLERELAHEQQLMRSAREAKEWAEKQARTARQMRGKAEAARKRLETCVHAGVCPHCQRTFKQLAAHMKSKHPEVSGG